MANIGVHKSGLGFINPSIIQDITDISNQVYDNFINISSNDADINDLSNNIGNIGTSIIGASLYSNFTGTGYNNTEPSLGGGISLGWDAGKEGMGHGCIAIGYKAGVINMGDTKFQDFNVAIGAYAANINQKYRSIAIGAYSGKENQGTASIAIGWNAAYNTQQSTSIAMGKEAGYNNQASYSIAIGREAGYNNQGFYSICFGDKAGRTATKIDAICIGRSSGEVAIGQNCIAIGQQANLNSDFSNCIVLNAQTNTALNPEGSSRFYVKPIRNSTTNNILYYDPFSGEITYNDLSNIVSPLNQLQEYSDASFGDVDISGDLIIQGNLTVNGTTTTINSTVLDISDTRIFLASSAPNTVATYGAGIEISGNKTITYESGDKFVSNVNFEAPNIIDLSSNYYTYKTNNDISVNNVLTKVNDLSSNYNSYKNANDISVNNVLTKVNDLSAIVNNPVLSVIPNITAIGTTLISNSSNTKISVNTNYGIDLSGLISVGDYVIISNVNNSVGFIEPDNINGLRIITELIPSGDEIYAFSFNASDNAIFNQTVNETFNIEFLNGKLITAGAINPYIIDLSTNYYTYKTNNDISVNNVNTILLDLSAVVANITDDADIVDLSTNFWDLSGYVNTLENSWVGNATTGLDMSGYDISNVGDIFASRGYNTYQTLGTEKIVNPPSNTLTLGGVNIGALNKRTRTSYSSAEECVSTWTTRTTPVNTWNSVCWSPELSLFCAVASSGSNRVITSPDGITWTTRTTNNNEWQSICWSPELSLFCAVSTTGTNNFVMTSPNGITWTTRTTDSLSRSSVCWSPELSLFCAVPFGGNNVMTSPDGITWTTQSISVSNEWRSVCWSPELSLFCAVSSNGSSNRVMTSPDGINWTTRTTNNNFWRSVCWSPELSLFCAVSSLGSNNLVMTSPDGINWTTRTTNNYYWISVCWSQELSLFCAVSDTGSLDRVMTSPDGINWTTRTTNNNEWTSVCWSPELSIFCAISRTGTIDGVMTSNIGMPNSKSVLKVNPSHMTITPTGYLGLNKTSPLEVLDVSGNITCDNLLQRSDIVKIGKNTGAAAGIGTVAIGDLTGVSGESSYSVLIGKEAGKNNCESYNIAIGFLAGEIDMSNSSVAVGFWAGETNMGFSCVAVGREAGQTNQGQFGIGIGRGAAQNNQKDNAIAIGRSAGRENQNFNSISIGYLAGEIDQSLNSVAIGYAAARYTQNRYAVALGHTAGNSNQGENCVAIGRGSATSNQGNHAIAVGIGAGGITQAVKGVAIGFYAGTNNQGGASIAIGSNAGHTNQSANSIILNATDTILNSSGTNTFYVKPIRNSTSANYLYYNTTSGEITYSATTSDDRLKHNEKDLSNCLSIINLLKPKIYDKTEIILDASYNGDLSGIEHYKEVGFIAQEVLNDIPDISFVVGETQHYNYVEDPSNIEQNIQVEGDKTYFLNYNHIFVYGIKAIQELSAELTATKLELANLKQLLDDMDVI